LRIERAQKLLLFAAALLAGCAVRHYQPAPISLPRSASELESRTLSDPGLEAFVEKNLGHRVTPWPPETWDLRLLTLAALYFNPSIQAARERIDAAQAAIITAGQRPNPALDASVGVPSPYLATLNLSVPIETAGKRGYRVQTARHLDQVAEFDLANTAWKVRSGVRAALLDYLLMARTLAELQSENQIQRQRVSLLQAQFAVGEIPRPEVDVAQIAETKTLLAVDAAVGRLDHAKAALAAALAIPVSALQDVDFSWPDLESPPGSEALSLPVIKRDALLNRMDVRRSLAEYMATESNLQLEVARQYPNVSIGPGFEYEESNSFFAPVASLILPIFNRNQGPIAEAEVARKQAATALLQTQAEVIAESEEAFALYSAALREFTHANDSLRVLQTGQEELARRSLTAGEVDRLTLNGVELQSSVAALARLDALNRAQTALGSLEDAVQMPLQGEFAVPKSVLPANSQTAARKEMSKHEQ
jgi:outer membrane protein, heavy metal efflux system